MRKWLLSGQKQTKTQWHNNEWPPTHRFIGPIIISHLYLLKQINAPGDTGIRLMVSTNHPKLI